MRAPFRRVGRGAVLVTAVLLTVGCAPSRPPLDPNAAAKLEAQVMVLTRDAAANNFAGAVKALDTLEAELTEASAKGDIDFARHQEIEQAIDAVRADLATAVRAAVSKPTAAPSVARATVTLGPSAAAAATNAAPRQYVPAPAVPAPAPAALVPAPVAKAPVPPAVHKSVKKGHPPGKGAGKQTPPKKPKK